MGIQWIGLFNQGLLGKWLWRFGKESSRLWHQVIAMKYEVARGGWCTRGVRGSYGRGMWKGISTVAERFFGQIVYVVGEGHRIRFWHDPWSGHIPLKNLFPDQYACSRSKEAWIFDLIVSTSEGGERSWNLQFRRAPYDWELEAIGSLFELLYSCMPRGGGEDKLSWKLTPNGVFDVRSFYNLLFGDLTVVFPWKSIRYVKVPKRVSFFLWTAAKDGILIIDNLVKRGQSLVNWCCMC